MLDTSENDGRSFSLVGRASWNGSYADDTICVRVCVCRLVFYWLHTCIHMIQFIPH